MVLGSCGQGLDSEDPSYAPNLVLKQGIEQKAGENAYFAASEPITLIGHRLPEPNSIELN